MRQSSPISEFRDFINLIENRIDVLAKSYGVEHLAGPQGFTVLYLWKHQDQEIFIKDIEKCLKVSKSVASNLIKRMEKNGFVEVIPSLEDRRFKQLVLTKLGFEKAQKAQDFHDAIHQQILDGIDKDDLLLAHQVFMKIKKNLEKGVEDV